MFTLGSSESPATRHRDLGMNVNFSTTNSDQQLRNIPQETAMYSSPSNELFLSRRESLIVLGASLGTESGSEGNNCQSHCVADLRAASRT